MRHRTTLPTLFAAAILLAAGGAYAQQPTVLHAQFSTQPADHSLTAQIEQVKRTQKPAWIGYQIAAPADFHSGSNSSHITFLESNENHYNYKDSYKDATYDHLILLMRVANGSIDNVRGENPDRQLDAGGLPFLWLTDVVPADSILLLQSLARANGPEKLRNDAVFLISLHQSPEAIPALTQLASFGNDLEIREKAAFWLASQRGHDGFLAIQRLAREDADPVFREKLTFDLTLAHEQAALDELIRMAHSDSSPQVRRQAQFWMAEKGGRKVAADLRSATEHDPDTEVRKSAVFALSRLPGDEAATQLIQVAQTSHDPDVRKQAVFWLGQSSDERALTYLTSLLRP